MRLTFVFVSHLQYENIQRQGGAGPGLEANYEIVSIHVAMSCSFTGRSFSKAEVQAAAVALRLGTVDKRRRRHDTIQSQCLYIRI